jgi:8-oxo-dGTP pyrophosphatase MutT (NUDIX family)
MAIRNAAKAIILHKGKILLNRNQNTFKDGLWGLPLGAVMYDLPGGGQNQFETLEEAVVRECLEETGYVVKIDRLGGIFEEISASEEYRIKYKNYAHKVHFIFVCSLTDKVAQSPTEKDFGAVELEWVDIDKLDEIILLPRAVHANLQRILDGNGIVYLGSELVP